MVYKAGNITVVDNDFTSGRIASNVSVFTAPGTFTVPTGINVVHAFIFGGGGGGGAGSSQLLPPADAPITVQRSGGAGGFGGAVYKQDISVTPGGSLTITRGTGGAGSNNTTGGAGNASSLVVGVTTYTANGGAGGNVASAPAPGNSGVPGTGSGGDINANVNVLWNQTTWTSSSLGGYIPSGTLLLALRRFIEEPVTQSSTSATWTGIYDETVAAGAAGTGETGTNASNAGSGKAGGVILIY